MSGNKSGNGNKSVVMLATTDLTPGLDMNSRVQITTAEHGDVFLSVYVGNEPNVRVYLRIPEKEWQRMSAITGR